MFLWESVILCGIGGVVGISVCAYGIVLIPGPVGHPGQTER